MRQHRNSMPCLVAWYRIFFCHFLGGLAVGRAKQVPSIQKNRGFSVLSLGVQRCGGFTTVSTSLRLSRSLSSKSRREKSEVCQNLFFEQAAAVDCRRACRRCWQASSFCCMQSQGLGRVAPRVLPAAPYFQIDYRKFSVWKSIRNGPVSFRSYTS